MEQKAFIENYFNEKGSAFTQISDSIWEYAETRFCEYKSSEILCKALREEGFTITKGIAGMDTAFIASFGSRKPIIAFLGEYDALYGASQEADALEKKATVQDGNGHGCGHHSLGTGSLAAAMAVKKYMQEKNLPGTIRFYGCPGEEGGSGKVYIAREGYFKDVDSAFTWHPGYYNGIMSFNLYSNIQVCFKFKGVSSHAGMSPHLGRSALDAVELMNVGCNYLREHIIPDARIHYAVTNSGGLSPNIVQSDASVLYLIRAQKQSQAVDIYNRVISVAQGAALMTGTTVEVVFDKASSDFILNRTLEKLLYKNLQELGPVPVDDCDISYATKIRSTMSENDKNYSKQLLMMLLREKSKDILSAISGKDIADILYPYVPTDMYLPGSSDVGDASYNMPLAQLTTVCCAMDTPLHSWQMVAQGKTALFHKGMLHAAKIMALSAIELLENGELVEMAKHEYAEKLGGQTYTCPIPAEVMPSPLR